jgi:hypothetical protein
MNKNGSATIWVGFIVLAILVIVGGVWYFEMEMSTKNISQQTTQGNLTTSVTSTVASNTKVYINHASGFEITYPSSWVTSTNPEAMSFLFAVSPDPENPGGGSIDLSAGLIGSCMSTEQYVQSTLESENSMIAADLGPVKVNDPNVDARQVQPVVGKGATIGGLILLSNRDCKSSSTAVMVRIYDSDFADRTQAQQNAYFQFISTFQFTN